MDHDHGTPRDGDHDDEDLVDFLDRHQFGPCSECEEIERRALLNMTTAVAMIGAIADTALEDVR